MEENKRDKIIDQIGKLSAMTSADSGAYQGEIANASAMMQRLMEKYCITWAEINEHKQAEQAKEMEEEFKSHSAEYVHKNVKAWRWRLARIIATITHTKHYSSSHADNTFSMVFFGVKENSEIASALYNEWVISIERMARKATDDNYKELVNRYGDIAKHNRAALGNENPRYFRVSWIDGCITGMSRAVEAEEDKTITSSQNALALYDKKVAEKYRELSKYFTKINTSVSRGYSSAGYTKGLETGSSIKLGSKRLDD